MLPIPGTQNLQHVVDNCAAAKLKLTADEWKSLAA
jgi:aryl-alcohol dehydrogenase-like predicted oxidoreductase